MKSIFETLAALGTGAILLSACGGSGAPANSAEVPAASDAKPMDKAAEKPADKPPTNGDKPAAMADKPAEKPAAAPTPTMSASAHAGAPPAKKPGTPKKAAGAKQGASGSCGEGTCS